jgi:phosphatidylglycerophosphatase A
MGGGLWFITILKEQPWIGIVAGIILFLLLFLLKKWLVAKLMGNEGES